MVGDFSRVSCKCILASALSADIFERAVVLHEKVPRFNPGNAIAVVESCLAETPATGFLLKEKRLPVISVTSEMRKLQIMTRSARAAHCASAGGRIPWRKNVELVTKATTFFVPQDLPVQYHHSVFEFEMSVMVLRKFVRPARLGNFPRTYRETAGMRARLIAQSEIRNWKSEIFLIHFRTASAMTLRLARHEGKNPAINAAPMIHAGVHASDPQGNAS